MCTSCKLWLHTQKETISNFFVKYFFLQISQFESHHVLKIEGPYYTNCTYCTCCTTLIKKKTQFSSYIKKFRWDRVQSHRWGRAFLSMRKCSNFSLYIYEEAFSHICICTRSLVISSNVRKILFSFLSAYCTYSVTLSSLFLDQFLFCLALNYIFL